MPSFVRLCIAAVDRGGHFPGLLLPLAESHLPHPCVPFVSPPSPAHILDQNLYLLPASSTGLDVDGIYRVWETWHWSQLRFLVKVRKLWAGGGTKNFMSQNPKVRVRELAEPGRSSSLELHVPALPVSLLVVERAITSGRYTCFQNIQDKVLYEPPAFKVFHTIPAPCGLPHVLVLGWGLFSSRSLPPCGPPRCSMVCLLDLSLNS